MVLGLGPIRQIKIKTPPPANHLHSEISLQYLIPHRIHSANLQSYQAFQCKGSIKRCLTIIFLIQMSLEMLRRSSDYVYFPRTRVSKA